MLSTDLVHALGFGIDPTSFERIQGGEILDTLRVRYEQVKSVGHSVTVVIDDHLQVESFRKSSSWG